MAPRARGGIWLLAVLCVLISQIGMHCHDHADSHPAGLGAAAPGIVVTAVDGAGGQPAACRWLVSPVVFPTLKRTTDAWCRMAPAPPAALLAAAGDTWGQLLVSTAYRPAPGVVHQAILPAGISLLVLIGVLRT
jgi:hypothetical protein